MSLVASEPLTPVQQAIYDTLTGDPVLTGLVTGVFDHVPEGQAYDYVTLGELTSVPDNRHGGFGRSVTATLHIWTRARGNAAGLAILGEVMRLLDHQDLTVAGHHTVSVRFEFSQTLVDPDSSGEIRHIPVRFRIETEQP